MRQEDIPDFEVFYSGDVVEADEGYAWTFEDISDMETLPSKRSIYLWNVTTPIYVELPETCNVVRFQGLTTVQQFVNGIRKGYRDAGVTDILSLLGDHHYYEGLMKVSRGHYKIILGT